jgi:N-acetylmuramoyl-L-alanine amidase
MHLPINPFSIPRSRIWQCLVVIVLGLAIFFIAAPADAQSPAVRYERALAREKAARAMTGTSVTVLRTIARSYEAIVHAYPRSGYADNALWQGAGVLQLAYERSGSVGDLQNARRLLSWLKREYPKASLAKQVDAKLVALNGRSKPAAKPTTVAAAKRPGPPPTAAPAAPVSAPVSPSSAGIVPATPDAPAPTVAAAAPEEHTIEPVSLPVATPVPMAMPVAAPPALPIVAAGEIKPPTRSPEPISDAVPAAWEAPIQPRVEALPALAMPNPAMVAPSENAVPVREITHTKLPKGDRITIELGREASYSTNRSANPDRVEIELNDAALAAALSEKLTNISGETIKSLSARRVGRTAARVSIELNGSPRFSTFPLYNPFRLVVDVEEDPAAAVAAAPSVTSAPPSRAAKASAPAPAKPQPASTIDDPLPAPTTPSSTGRGDYSLARQLGLSVSRIVIDPGHGGHDPGARANGVNEADVVLDVALRVEALLKAQPGIDVVLTRRTNTFIPLEERTAIANRESADMFLSIHVNASPRSATRGIETYLLDFASNPDAEALAARENATSAQSMRVLPDIVKAITLNNKVDESRELARMVQTSLVGRITPLSKGVKDFGVKRAPFVVLIGAQMPSVLAEISFLTNRTDASLLKQASHRQRIAQALADAVVKYRASLKAPSSTSAQTARQQ